MDDFLEALEKALQTPIARLNFRYVKFPKLKTGPLDDRIAALRHGMSIMEPLSHPIRECRILPDADEIRDAIADLEALAADLENEAPEYHCLRSLAMELVAEGHRQLGDISGCITALREAEKLAASAVPDWVTERCFILLHLAEALAENGARTESTAVALKAADLAAGANGRERRYACYTLGKLSDILAKNDALAESLTTAAKAVEIAESIHGTIEDAKSLRLPDALLQLGEVHHLRGNFAAAVAALLRAKSLWEEGPAMRMNEKVGVVLHKLASIREATGDLAGSIAFRREAVDFWRRYRDRVGYLNNPRACGELALALGNLGLALTQDHQWREGGAALEDALALSTALGKGESGEARDYADAFDTCRRALRE